ncbi:PadR family transcriptional regulator [Tsukamurella sp. 8F]|uniref:PadR family transcriptional regulator n=1 Tax=unclassified Tsukamurella TaxID=2633480 RepID=UPI0023B96352|nr:MULTISPECIES: PadR family transcriptional regulator [unclassified Tsukamurella]MDF0529446.1 PadR family transcriptional regulator [Tsukamurella sp. 8J]MDF0589355.1 PadR family transcriptional regulator [Tsukamurella sp. 8F]
MLELAVLGLLLEAPMHGYEIRKRLTELLGPFRAFSYGSLYPALRRMRDTGLLSEEDEDTVVKKRRARRVYRITEAGQARFADLVADTGPQSFTDDGFGVHLAFFTSTPAQARLRILEGRRRQVEERREELRRTLEAPSPGEKYTRQLHQLSLETSEREVRWLNELIAAESASTSADSSTPKEGEINGV